MNIAALEKMLASGKDSAMLRFGLGKAYLDEGEFQQAVGHFQACLHFDAEYSAAWKLLGIAYRDAGEASEAVASWDKGLLAAQGHGDKQSELEMTVFLKKLKKTMASDSAGSS